MGLWFIASPTTPPSTPPPPPAHRKSGETCYFRLLRLCWGYITYNVITNHTDLWGPANYWGVYGVACSELVLRTFGTTNNSVKCFSISSVCNWAAYHIYLILSELAIDDVRRTVEHPQIITAAVFFCTFLLILQRAQLGVELSSEHPLPEIITSGGSGLQTRSPPPPIIGSKTPIIQFKTVI